MIKLTAIHISLNSDGNSPTELEGTAVPAARPSRPWRQSFVINLQDRYIPPDKVKGGSRPCGWKCGNQIANVPHCAKGSRPCRRRTRVGNLRHVFGCIWIYCTVLNQPHSLIVWPDQHPPLHDVDRSPVAPPPRQLSATLHTNTHRLSRQNYNAFLVKKVPEGPIFSSEPVRELALPLPDPSDLSFDRVTSVTSTRTSTLVLPTPRQAHVLRCRHARTDSSQTIDIRDSASGIQVTVDKSKATPHQVSTARTTFTIRNRSGGRRALGVVAGLTKKGYRPDLRAVSTFSLVFLFFNRLGTPLASKTHSR